jgi:predicted nucleic acid-binding protein
MMEASTYVLDANVFIEAARRYYAFDLHSRFWDILIEHANSGVIESIDLIKTELEKGKGKDGEEDELIIWANGDFNHAFRTTDEEDVIESYGKIMSWVQSQTQYTEAAKAQFANVPDGWLVAYALAKGRIVVTQEVLKPDIKIRVPIPNVCGQFNVRYIDTFVMLRELGAKLA